MCAAGFRILRHGCPIFHVSVHNIPMDSQLDAGFDDSFLPEVRTHFILVKSFS